MAYARQVELRQEAPPMPDALVETKLVVPRARARTVDRPRLEELLARGSDAALVLVSAPAGFGKTTLLVTWLARSANPHPVAWVSLDQRDRDASTFWTYVVRAVDRAAPGAATAALELLRVGQASVEAVLTALLNELSVLAGDLTLVLDDYHLAEGPATRLGMVYLLEHLPPQVHLVVSSRSDPALPLARLRARGELVEVRAADLRFTGSEAATYLNEVNALALSPDDVAALERRTEGWAAALQLAALSLSGRGDRSQFIHGFAGDDRFVVDYLADEVLDRLPQAVRRFLLDTSVLDRLTGPLCDAVTGGVGGKAALESLERQNLFVVPLDGHREWYRYHHLFADVLRAHLNDERPDDVRRLHLRAADWYDQAGDAEAAVRHALAAGDVDLAAARAELAVPALLRERREAVIRGWVQALPADVVQDRPVLAVGFIGALAASNEFDSLDRRLTDVERLLAGPPADLVVADTAALARVPGAVQTYRAALALVSGDLGGTVRHAELALARAAHDDYLTRASASALVGLASWAAGDLAVAHASYRVATENLLRVGHLSDVLGCTVSLADIDMTRGRWGDAERGCREALALVPATASLRGAADLHVQLSRVAMARGDLPGAAEQLRRAEELGEAAGLPQHPYRWRVALAEVRAAQGDTATALDLLEEAERVYVADFAPQVRPVDAVRARVLAACGQVAEALAWASRRGVTPTDDLTYLHEYEHVTLARILLADHTASRSPAPLAAASSLLNRLLTAAEAGERTAVVIEVLLLQARAQAATGDEQEALQLLERARRLAGPEGLVLADPVATRVTGAHGHPAHPLVDPLSSRELDVLRLLGSELDGPAIARTLGVSLSTVRTHTQHVYAKLAVTNRRAAVRRAHQLNLFSRNTAR
ncbi:MAG: LuxR C-terminal-related transcriptional regulator [Ornithinibacter sp.]